ncbi:hypothetical protein RCL_jg26284.t1 [Rhizophagus clarus]|uniref:Uncharacterized protein n=1 Tax=Rhizophagus clarus TaxID=94130 RepID=A0A8H3KY05_9GLOM|nr:hypothetical protein RCL_jg26284.t1 [Rhizophagus clarus]
MFTSTLTCERQYVSETSALASLISEVEVFLNLLLFKYIYLVFCEYAYNSEAEANYGKIVTTLKLSKTSEIK